MDNQSTQAPTRRHWTAQHTPSQNWLYEVLVSPRLVRCFGGFYWRPLL